MNDLEKLLPLGDGIVAGIDDVNVGAQALRGLSRQNRLQLLIVILRDDERDHETKSFHASAPGARRTDAIDPRSAYVVRGWPALRVFYRSIVPLPDRPSRLV